PTPGARAETRRTRRARRARADTRGARARSSGWGLAANPRPETLHDPTLQRQGSGQAQGSGRDDWF
ncbi:hypothetical protein RZS08_42825, partial [Arthrospira platensis SPKY1]|nr:hypothetical protein [Arthrospira platensis SPKY1]